MRIGLFELVLILAIAAVTIGPGVAAFVSRWMRRAQKSNAEAAYRRAVRQAERRAERDEILHRFQKVSVAFVALAAVGLLYTLVLRPIDAEAQPYTAPAVRQAAAQSAAESGSLPLAGWESVACIRRQGDWLYLAAQDGAGGSAIVRLREDGSGLASILSVEGEITGFDFDPAGDLWFTVLAEGGGALCRAGYDGWGAATEQVVTQIDGRSLSCPAAVAAAPDGKIYFADAAAAPAQDGAEAALRTELMAHTATGRVYVYDPAARTVEQVLGGIAGAAGLALSPDGGTLYVSDLGSRCIWAVSPEGRELTAGGRQCALFAGGLPGYPGALATGEDGAVYVGYRWARSGWLEDHAGGTLLRGAALRLSRRMQKGLFGAPEPAAEALSAAGEPLLAFAGSGGGTTALCPGGSRLVLGSAGAGALFWQRM